MNYSEFSLTDLILDEYFQQWIQHPTPEANRFWQEWIDKHPDKVELVAQARLIVLSVDFTKTSPQEIDDEKILYKIKASIRKKEQSQHSGESSKVTISPGQTSGNLLRSERKIFTGWQKIAAVLIGFLMMVTAIYYLLPMSSEAVIHTTAYGQTDTIILPDQSEVFLNGNSTLQVQPGWEEGKSREVWLTGEAYFNIQEIAAPEGKEEAGLVKFIVHTEALDIEVVGTQFNVNTRREKTEVVLSSGKVRLKIDNHQGEEIVMQPGEMVGYSIKSREVVRKVVDPAVYSSWKSNHLIFDEVPLQKVAQQLEDIYGLEVVFEDEQLEGKIFKGIVPSDNIDVLLNALSEIYNIKISKNNGKIIFHKE